MTMLNSLVLAAVLGGTGTALAQATSPAPQKVLRYAFEIAETSLDPVKVVTRFRPVTAV